MTSVCMYFQVHQPYRLRRYTVFDVGQNHEYFDDRSNEDIMKKVANRCYIPANKILLNLIKKTNGRFRVSFSISGIALEQMEKYAPEALESFKKLAKTGCVEFLSETYHHSMAYLYSKEEFIEQVRLHKDKIKRLFDLEPKVFRNTELIYNNDMAKAVERMGYKGVLAEGADKVLGWRSPNHVYDAKHKGKIRVLLKNYKLSDDIAFRFSDTNSENYPVTPERYAKEIHEMKGDVVNLFMDYETFGEHQWKDTGIFDFLENLPENIIGNGDDFMTISETIEKFEAKDVFDSPEMISWADNERDLSAWLGNKMQKEAAKEIYKLRDYVLKSGDYSLVSDWRKVQTSDHLYYMCTKWFSDGDVHKYFNPYDTPYEAFTIYMSIINDIMSRASPEKDLGDAKIPKTAEKAI